MDRGKKPANHYGNKNSKMYMDLKDIIRENALLYLPAKSLFRCTGVCRDWKLRISTPFFAHNQSHSLRSTSGFFYRTPGGMLSFMSLDPMAYGVPDPCLKFLPEPVDIRSSSNGLLCCQGHTGDRPYYICNPATKKWKKLPKPDNDHGRDPALVLVFEPSLLDFIADYKLVCAFPSELDGYEFDIYSSLQGTWRTSREICFANWKLYPKSGVHANGTVYWRSTQGITSFDLTAERFQLLSYANGALGTMNGKLYAAYARGNKLVVSILSNTYANTMQIHNHANAWVQLRPEINLDIALDRVCRESYGFSYYDASGKTVHSNGVMYVGGDMVLLRHGKTYYSYDLKKRATTTLGEFDVDLNAGLVGYVNSLVEL